MRGYGRERMGISLMDLRPGIQGGSGEIQCGARRGKGGNGACVRENDPRPAAVAAFKVPLFTQVG